MHSIVNSWSVLASDDYKQHYVLAKNYFKNSSVRIQTKVVSKITKITQYRDRIILFNVEVNTYRTNITEPG